MKFIPQIFLFLILTLNSTCSGQLPEHSFIYYPGNPGMTWQKAVGVSFMTTPRAITEEFHNRVPAFDLTEQKYISDKNNLNLRLRSQLLQNELIAEIGHNFVAEKNYGFAAQLGFSGWFGFIKSAAFNSKGYGFMCYPSIIFGMVIKENLYLTLKPELILNLSQHDIAGTISSRLDKKFISGEAITFYLEQPFIKSNSIVLGFRAMYCDFYWQTWALRTAFEHHIFYPEVIALIIL